MSDPWQGFAETHDNDERITAPITKITDFGIFIGLEGGIEGIVHIGDISWSKPGEAAINRFSEGDVVDAVILAIDVERQRVSLGIKDSRLGNAPDTVLPVSYPTHRQQSIPETWVTQSGIWGNPKCRPINSRSR